MIKKLISVALASAFSVSVMSAPDDLAALSKDLKIMETVMDTAIEQTMEESRFRVMKTQATYLKDQGVVFRFDMGHGGSVMRGLLGDFDIDIEGLGALGELMGRGSGSEHHREVHVIELDGDRIDLENVHALKDKLRDLSLEQRDLGYEHREVVRRKRDLEFEVKRADEDRQKELNVELKTLEQELVGLMENKKELKKVVAKVKKKKEVARKKKMEKRKAERTRFLSGFESSLADTFCRYGTGLKSLSNDEKVNVILENFGDSEGQVKKKHTRQKGTDRIYVFSMKDIKSCVNDKIKPDDLMAKAEVYNF